MYAFYHSPRHDGSLYDCLLDSMARVKSVDDKTVFIFVSDINANKHIDANANSIDANANRVVGVSLSS